MQDRGDNAAIFTGRRGFLAGAAALVSASGFALPAAAAPTTGGTLRLGMSGGSTTDSLNPTTYTDWVPANIGWQMMNGLVEIDDQNHAQPELLESWEPKPGATEWVLNVRKGITFHNGKTLDADDVLYSINLHRGNTTSAAKAVLSGIVDLKKTDTHQIIATLSAPNAELQYLLSDYHVLVVPNGFTDWAKPVGTGGYVLESFEPGVRAVTKKQGSYWKPNRAYVDSIETVVINDTSARTSALISGQVDAVNRLDARTVDLLKRNQALKITRSPAGQHAVLVMNTTDSPYADNNVRMALKYAIDRQKILDTVLKGYGVIGNDQPIPRSDPNYAADIPQHGYDPDKAKFYMKKAGMDSLKVSLDVSEAAFTGASDTAILFQSAAAGCGITVDVKRDPSDGYWDNVWMKAPFCASYWGGRPTADQMLSIGYASTAKWNDSFWKNAAFDKLLVEARGTLDTGKRKQMYGDLQRMLSDDGGVIIPMFIDYLEACNSRVQGVTSSAFFDFMGQRIGEKVWLTA